MRRFAADVPTGKFEIANAGCVTAQIGVRPFVPLPIRNALGVVLTVRAFSIDPLNLCHLFIPSCAHAMRTRPHG